MLVVSIHDVDPSSLDEVRWLLARLDELAIRPRVLKVIPAPDGVEISEPAAPELVALLRAEQAAGSEVVVHGYTHRTAGHLRGDGIATLRARLFAPRDAELLSVDHAEGARRLAAGRAALEGLGLAADGFCAPAWLFPHWLEDAARAAGYRHVIGLLQLSDLGRGRHRPVPAFGYLGADWLQERLVGMGGDFSVTLHRWLADRVPDLRAFLHPAGASSSADCARTLERIARLAAHEPLTTYRGLLEAA